jgi:CRP-like cAMP-binding protein
VLGEALALALSPDALNQHPFVGRLRRPGDLSVADLKSLNEIIDGELLGKKRRGLIVDGYNYRELCFVADGYAVRFKLLHNGKRQILNVVLPRDIVCLPGSFYERAVYSVTAITDLRMHVCPIDSYLQLCYRRPQFGSALSWIAVQEATTYAEHIIDVGRRTPIERLPHFLLELHARLKAVDRAESDRFNLPFSQEVMADVLGLSVPHLNRMLQRLRSEKLIADSQRTIKILNPEALHALAQFQPLVMAPIPPPAKLPRITQ